MSLWIEVLHIVIILRTRPTKNNVIPQRMAADELHSVCTLKQKVGTSKIKWNGSKRWRASKVKTTKMLKYKTPQKYIFLLFVFWFFGRCWHACPLQNKSGGRLGASSLAQHILIIVQHLSAHYKFIQVSPLTWGDLYRTSIGWLRQVRRDLWMKSEETDLINCATSVCVCVRARVSVTCVLVESEQLALQSLTCPLSQQDGGGALGVWLTHLHTGKITQTGCSQLGEMH